MTTDSTWSINVKPALDALKKLRTSIGLTDKKASEGFDEAADGAKRARDEFGRFIATGEKGGKKIKGSFGGLNSAIGTVSTGLGGLVMGFGAVSAAGVAAFAAVAIEGVRLASQLEQAEVTFTNIFQGDEGAAKAFLGGLNQQALELGVKFSDLSSFAKSLAPDTESVEQFERLTLAAVTLEKSDPDKTFDDVRIAIEGALSGDFVSLQDRFDLPKTTIANIKRLQGELGAVEGIVAGLEAEFERTGQNLESFGDTFSATQDRIASRADTLKAILGEPILDALKEEFSLFDEILGENSEELQLFAAQLGDIVANVVDFIGTGINDFLADLDFSKFQELATSFFELVEKGRLVIDLLFDMKESTPNESIDDLTSGINTLTKALDIAAKGIALIKAVLADAAATAKNVATIFKLATGQITDVEAFAAFVDPQEAFNDSLRESVKAMDDSNERLKENKKLQDERKEALNADTSAELARADAILKSEKAAQEAEKAAKAQADIDEKTAKATADREKKLTDIQRKEAQKRFDDEVKNAQKREDIARKNADSLEDIFRKQDQAIADEAKGLTREEQDIARKGASERKQIEKTAANERVEVERNFRQQLQDIQRSFNQSAQDAERSNDAQAFLQAVRARDEQIEVAKSERDVSLGDVGRGAGEQRADLKEQLAQEVEDSKIANSRKVEDLNARLNQELEAQAIKNERDLEQQAIQEERQRERRDLEAQRTLENFERTEAEKQAKLAESLEKQFAILEAAKVKELELLTVTEAKKTKIVTAEMERRAKALAEAEAEAEQTSLPPLAAGTSRRPNQQLTPMGEGGDMVAGQTALVGEKGMELFTAPTAGRIIPNQAMFSPPAPPGMAANNVNNSRNLSVEQMGINPGNAVLSRMVQNEMAKMMELLG